MTMGKWRTCNRPILASASSAPHGCRMRADAVTMNGDRVAATTADIRDAKPDQCDHNR
jgi:hypothetical protein